MQLTKAKQPVIEQIGELVHMDCPICKIHKTVETENAKFAYDVIGKFRLQHTHLVEI